MTKKYTYTLTINNGASQKSHSYSFDYGNSKNISLKISDKGITITYFGTVEYKSIDTDSQGIKKRRTAQSVTGSSQTLRPDLYVEIR